MPSSAQAKLGELQQSFQATGMGTRVMCFCHAGAASLDQKEPLYSENLSLLLLLSFFLSSQQEFVNPPDFHLSNPAMTSEALSSVLHGQSSQERMFIHLNWARNSEHSSKAGQSFGHTLAPALGLKELGQVINLLPDPTSPEKRSPDTLIFSSLGLSVVITEEGGLFCLLAGSGYPALT